MSGQRGVFREEDDDACTCSASAFERVLFFRDLLFSLGESALPSFLLLLAGPACTPQNDFHTLETGRSRRELNQDSLVHPQDYQTLQEEEEEEFYDAEEGDVGAFAVDKNQSPGNRSSIPG